MIKKIQANNGMGVCYITRKIKRKILFKQIRAMFKEELLEIERTRKGKALTKKQRRAEAVRRVKLNLEKYAKKHRNKNKGGQAIG